jgi:hypothetical protein
LTLEAGGGVKFAAAGSLTIWQKHIELTAIQEKSYTFPAHSTKNIPMRHPGLSAWIGGRSQSGKRALP